MPKKKRPTSAKPCTCDKCGVKAEAIAGHNHRRCSGQPAAEDGSTAAIRDKHMPKIMGAGVWQ